MTFDLIAFDLDGTTLNSSSNISEKNYAALKKAHKMGVKLVPCTGRPMFQLPEKLNLLIDEFGFSVFPFVITDNGALVYGLPQKEQLYAKKISKETALALIKEGRKHLAVTYGNSEIQGAVDNKGIIWDSPEAQLFLSDFNARWGPFPTCDLEELIEWNENLVKVSMNFINNAEYEKCRKIFSAWPDLSVSSSEARNIEIMRSGVSKGEALSFVSRHSGIPIERIMAIGDNLNDVEMIQRAGLGVAMGNAIPELKEKADWVTSTNDDDGLALAIEKMLSGAENS
jgi:Cof subfamily protein (haloacid dehalogenase superfamily)